MEGVAIGLRLWLDLPSTVQAWVKAGVFDRIYRELLKYYDQQVGIDWEWASLDGRNDLARIRASIEAGPSTA